MIQVMTIYKDVEGYQSHVNEHTNGGDEKSDFVVQISNYYTIK